MKSMGSMEDSFCSLSCPNCQQSLFEAVLIRCGFIAGLKCPYCASEVRWAKGPLFLVLFGLITAGTSAYCFINKFQLPYQLLQYTPYFLGIGVGFLLMGIVFTRLEHVEKTADEDPSRVSYQYWGL